MVNNELREFLMIVADVCWKIVDLLAEIFPKAHMLVELVRELEDRAVHDAYVVDGMRLHGVDDDGEVDGPNDDVVVLEDKNKLMGDLLHDILDVLSETVPFTPLLNNNPVVLLVLLPESLLKAKVILLLLGRDDTAFESTAIDLNYLSSIADDKYGDVVEGRLLLDGGYGLVYYFSRRVGSDWTSCDDDCQIQR